MDLDTISRTPEYASWRSMIDRCYKETDKDYPAIGGRGIRVCREWHEIDGFLRDMGKKPANTILTRLDRDADFTPENTTWKKKVNARENELYSIWKGMKRRCGQLGNQPHDRYAGRGIRVCDEWVNDFEAFAKHIGPRPGPEFTVDRINNDKGYEPGNVRWATKIEQGANRSDNIWLEYQGERRTISEWARHVGVTPMTFQLRVDKLFKESGRGRMVTQRDPTNMEIVATYECVADASKSTGVGRAAIQKCLSGANRSSGGFFWEYDQT